jgi:hypothetical protein
MLSELRHGSLAPGVRSRYKISPDLSEIHSSALRVAALHSCNARVTGLKGDELEHDFYVSIHPVQDQAACLFLLVLLFHASCAFLTQGEGEAKSNNNPQILVHDIIEKAREDSIPAPFLNRRIK